MSTEQKNAPASWLPLRGAFGGLLMGLANLVPGISGGTMLLSTGIYPEFIRGVAEVTTLRFRPRSMILLGSVVAAAATAILLLAGATKDLVVEHRFVMYSLFIGLTLGGIPIVWRRARPISPSLIVGALVGLTVMALMAMGDPADNSGAGPSYLLLFLSGLAGASAMILPGISGGYLLLLLGQYVPILSAVDDFKEGLLATPRDMDMVVQAVKVGLPVAIGMVIGVVAVSNLLKWLLERYRKATLGVLLGLLVGAVLGLWPFEQPVQPEPGQIIKGVTVTASNAAAFDQEDWPTERFDPTGLHILGALALVAAGFGTTVLIGKLDRDDTDL